ncbi:NAD-dependent epimerase/dehydratase family protein [Candidatus Parcubacteria bacterium]|nr:MAG: NAD-dependent epimerase/dehydratase family protein [Candidatus Parcubacteria bacterium]
MSKRNHVVVTGGAGFIGSHLTDALIKKGYRVTVIDALTTGSKKNLNPKALFRRGDVTRYETIAPLVRGADTIFHTAALARIQPSIIDPKSTFLANVHGTFNVLMAARAAGVRRVVYSASSSAYGDQKTLPLSEHMTPGPKNMYALSKLMGEQMCQVFSQLYGLETVSLRYFNVFGPRQTAGGPYATVIGIFLRQLREGKPLTIVGDGEIRRDFTYVDDVVRANIVAMGSQKVGRGEVINIGTGTNYSINDVAAAILGVGRAKLKEAVQRHRAIYIPPRPGEARATKADNHKARQLLGWRPRVAFYEGLAKARTAYLK